MILGNRTRYLYSYCQTWHSISYCQSAELSQYQRWKSNKPTISAHSMFKLSVHSFWRKLFWCYLSWGVLLYQGGAAFVLSAFSRKHWYVRWADLLELSKCVVMVTTCVSACHIFRCCSTMFLATSCIIIGTEILCHCCKYRSNICELLLFHVEFWMWVHASVSWSTERMLTFGRRLCCVLDVDIFDWLNDVVSDWWRQDPAFKSGTFFFLLFFQIETVKTFVQDCGIIRDKVSCDLVCSVLIYHSVIPSSSMTHSSTLCCMSLLWTSFCTPSTG